MAGNLLSAFMSNLRSQCNFSRQSGPIGGLAPLTHNVILWCLSEFQAVHPVKRLMPVFKQVPRGSPTRTMVVAQDGKGFSEVGHRRLEFDRQSRMSWRMHSSRTVIATCSAFFVFLSATMRGLCSALIHERVAPDIGCCEPVQSS